MGLAMETVHSDYLHAIDGRLRVKIGAVKKSPHTAGRVTTLLVSLDGVSEVAANELTGNVLVLYDPERISQQQILESLAAHGLLNTPPAKPKKVLATQSSYLGRKVAQELAVAGCVALIKLGFRAAVAAVA
jgi:hypothetical protein